MAGHRLVAIALTALVVGCDAPPSAPESSQPETPARATEAIAALRTQLGAALREALSQGPLAAIDACRVEAPRLAQELSGPGVRVGRTSHRLRNPANAPADWMQPLLEEFQQADAQPGSARTVDLGDGRTGYAEPIYVQPPCLACHGASLDPALEAHIQELYPEDQATGFALGDFRGLFWAEVDAAP